MPFARSPRKFFAAAALLLSSSLLSAAAQKVTKDIAYVSGPDGPELADLYQPEGAGSGPYPAVVYIHGGSWRSGSKSDFRQLATDLSAKGYVGFSINYDLHASAYPISWQEAAAAVRFLRAHAAEYRIDPDKIFVAGASAGGELAALIALAPDGPAKPSAAVPNAATPVAGAIILNGVFDLTGSYGVIKRYLGGTCADVHAVCLESSPMQHIHPNAPPFFVGHGTSDHTVPYASAQLFTSQMQAAGNAVTLFTAQGGPHMYFGKKAYYAANLAALEAFLAQNIRPK